MGKTLAWIAVPYAVCVVLALLLAVGPLWKDGPTVVVAGTAFLRFAMFPAAWILVVLLIWMLFARGRGVRRADGGRHGA